MNTLSKMKSKKYTTKYIYVYNKLFFSASMPLFVYNGVASVHAGLDLHLLKL